MQKLDKTSLGCYFPLWESITIAIGSAVVVFFILLLNKKFREMIKYKVYMRFNVLINDFGPENLEEMKYGAFISYK